MVMTTSNPNNKTVGSIFCTGEMSFQKAEALALPKATPTKVYAVFKLLTFGHPNENKDGFRVEDVGDAWKTIIGSGINFAHTDFPLGAVIAATSDENAITCVGALQRRQLRALSINPETMPETCTCSMEVRFNWADCRYKVGDMEYDAAQADYMGISWDPERYDCRWIKPIEFDACALCIKGSEADHGAVYEAVSAMANEEAKKAQEQRSAKSGIEILPGGNAVKPAGYTEFADDVNYLLPLDTEAQVKAAMSCWGEEESRAKYSEKAQKIIAERIAKAAEKFGIPAADTKSNTGGAKSTVSATVNEELEKFKTEELPKLLATAREEGKTDAMKDIDAKVEAAKIAAVEEYKQAQAKAEARFKELDTILPFAEGEKAKAMEDVAKADDLAFATMKAERALKALEEMKKGTAKATAAKTLPTPRAGQEGIGEDTITIWAKAE